jgi:LDH2 family malate/lactate/ureidoglycolate dehydrogenase
MTLAIAKAKDCGIGQVIVRNSTHYGSSAVHAVQAANAGCIGTSYTNAGPEMAPWGGREGAVGTNPWGIAAPTDMGFPVVMDFALTTAGKGMMQWQARSGQPMPLDWALTAWKPMIRPPRWPARFWALVSTRAMVWLS